MGLLDFLTFLYTFKAATFIIIGQSFKLYGIEGFKVGYLITALLDDACFYLLLKLKTVAFRSQSMF